MIEIEDVCAFERLMELECAIEEIDPDWRSHFASAELAAAFYGVEDDSLPGNEDLEDNDE